MSLRRRDSPHPSPLFFSEADEKERVSAFDKAQGPHAEFNSKKGCNSSLKYSSD